MTHLHLPDGVLSFWLWGPGYLLAMALIALSLFWLKKTDINKKLALLGLISAVMILGMSLEIVPIFYHLNLSVLAGILLGPILGIIAAFISNFILALLGHGGITVLGLNSLILMFEVFVGWFLFKILARTGKSIFWRGFLATFITLVLSTFLAIGIVVLAGADFKKFMEISLPLGFIGWVLEGTVTGFILTYLKKIKPDLINNKPN